MTYFQFKKYILLSLSEISGEYAAYETEKIVSHIFGLDRLALSLRLREEAPDKTEEADKIIARRKNGEPLAYILGNTDFFGLGAKNIFNSINFLKKMPLIHQKN